MRTKFRSRYCALLGNVTLCPLLKKAPALQLFYSSLPSYFPCADERSAISGFVAKVRDKIWWREHSPVPPPPRLVPRLSHPPPDPKR